MAELRSEEDTPVVEDVSLFLVHPRYASLQPVMRLLYERGNDSRRRASASRLFHSNAFWYGRLREALPHLDDPAMSAGRRAEAAYRAYVLGLPIPEETLELALDSALIDSITSMRTVFHAGAFAADRGRWSDHADAIAVLQQRAERALGEADSIIGLFWAGGAVALEGYGLWRQGQPTPALPMLEDPHALGYPWWVVRLWLGQLYQELGRLRDAERVYRSHTYYGKGRLSTKPLSQRQLGKIYEQLEEYDRAMEAYEYFAHYWRDADPELQPMVEEARQAAIRLRGLRRE